MLCAQHRLCSSAPSWAAALSRHWLARSASSITSVIESESGFTKLQGFTDNGFIVNNMQVEGSILCCPDIWMLWKASGMADVTPASLAMVEALKPTPDVVILGTGSRMQQPPAMLSEYLRSKGVALEVLDTRNAIAYFNFLNDEGRLVVAALLPPGTPNTTGTAAMSNPAAAASP